MGFLLVENVLNIFLVTKIINAYRKDFDKTKYMRFLIKNDKLLKQI